MKITPKRIIVFACVIILSSIIVYYNSNYYIKKHEWKNSSGSSIGDFLSFSDTTYAIKYRSIYQGSVNLGYIAFCIEDYLIIYSYDEHGFGNYCKKDCSYKHKSRNDQKMYPDITGIKK